MHGIQCKAGAVLVTGKPRGDLGWPPARSSSENGKEVYIIMGMLHADRR